MIISHAFIVYLATLSNPFSYSSVVETYEYDYLGHRTAKTSNGVRTDYVTDLSSGYSQVLKAETNTGTVYYTRGFELISRREGTVASYYIYDGGLSVRALTNEAGIVTDTLVFDAFGNASTKTGSSDNPYGFQGEEQDETGLYYLRARYMDPATGTFTTMDTYGGSLTDPMSLHKYLFANSNPVMYSDPSGHFSLQELGASMAISSILAGACYSSCVIVAAILDASTGSNRLSKYSISGLVYSMLVGFIMGGIAFELGAIFASLGLSFLQYLIISIVCAIIGIGLKYAGDRLKQSDYTGIGIVVSTLGDVGLVAAFAAASTGLLAQYNEQSGVVNSNQSSKAKVYRGAKPSDSPDIIFEKGFTPKGTHGNVYRHIESSTTAGNFVSSSPDISVANGYVQNNGWVYVIETDNYIDVNALFGNNLRYAASNEYSIIGGVKSSEIVGAYKVYHGEIVGDFIPNPNFGG